MVGKRKICDWTTEYPTPVMAETIRPYKCTIVSMTLCNNVESAGTYSRESGEDIKH